MVVGEVTASREIRLAVPLRDNVNIVHDVPATLDTGFGGFLTLPSVVIDTLELDATERSEIVVLGDGSEREVLIYSVLILWDGQERVVDAFGRDTFPLIGMALAYGMVATIQFTDGGPIVLFQP